MAGRVWRHLGTVIMAGACAGGLLAASVLAMPLWAGELAASWTPHITAGLVVLAVAALLCRRRTWAAVHAVLAIVLLVGMLPAVLDSAQAMAGGDAAAPEARLRLVFANLNIDNTEIPVLARWLAGQDSDVIVVTEALPRHMTALVLPWRTIPGGWWRRGPTPSAR